MPPVTVHPRHNRTGRVLAAAGSGPRSALEFPGCDSVSLPTWSDVWTYEGRIEYWSAETGKAWVLRDAGPVHEIPPHLLGELLTRLGQERGSRIRRQARDAGLAEGLARERALLGRLAARKFGLVTAERLAGLIAGVANREHLAGVGDLIIDGDDGDDLLARLGST